MILALLVLVPFGAGLLAVGLGRSRPALARHVALAALLVDLALLVALWLSASGPVWGEGALVGDPTSTGATASARSPGIWAAAPWLARVSWSWLSGLGVSLSLGLDGLSLVMVLLTLVLGAVAVGVSTRVTRRVGLYHLCLLWALAGILGVFLALDLVLLYIFWELMIVPMAALILLWGHEGRRRAALQFFLFTQAGGLAMLLSILGLGFAHQQAFGRLDFTYEALRALHLAPDLQVWLALGFLLGFAVKLPALGIHTWLPDAHTEAPTAGSVILAGLLLKTGGYGLLRFGVPLLPDAAAAMAPALMILGAAGVLYGALLALGQTDVKRLVAYSSVSHMGFVLLGIYAWNDLALQGVVLQMVCHGLATGGLFVAAGLLGERLGTRDLSRMGGLARDLPRLGGLTLLLALASLGLPGLGNFLAELLVLLGAMRVSPWITVAAALGLVASTLYALRLVGRVFHGPTQAPARDEPSPPAPREPSPPAPREASPSAPDPRWVLDLDARELLVLGALSAGLLWLGLYPQPLVDLLAPALDHLQSAAMAAPWPLEGPGGGP
jgi:NADH-quinone oxidoreductase subunit M